MTQDKTAPPRTEATKGQEVEHGFDRTASHSSGEYVCTCGDPDCKPYSAPAQPAQEAPVAWWDGDAKFATPFWRDLDRRTGGTQAFGCDIPLYSSQINQRAIEALKQIQEFIRTRNILDPAGCNWIYDKATNALNEADPK